MTPTVTLLAPWMGPAPYWLPRFTERALANAPLVRVQLLYVDSREVARLVLAATGIRLRPNWNMSPRKLCDFRPAFGQIFADLLGESPWWGWCDLDVVFGDLLSFLTPERLENCDLITDSPVIVNGPFTIMRNSEQMRTLYRKDDLFREVFSSPEHVAWDEHGFTDIVKNSPEVRALFLSDVHTHDNESGPPILRGRKLFAEDGRELLAYHFPRTKRWPI